MTKKPTLLYMGQNEVTRAQTPSLVKRTAERVKDGCYALAFALCMLLAITVFLVKEAYAGMRERLVTYLGWDKVPDDVKASQTYKDLS